MGTVTAYDMASIQSALGGSNPISLNEYYRGGSYVPTTRSTTVREPTSGEYYSRTGTMYNWQQQVGVTYYIQWAANFYNNLPGGPNVTSYTISGYTYYRGSYRSQFSDGYGTTFYFYGIYRTSSSTVSINTGVPSSGQISISQLYGAENP